MEKPRLGFWQIWNLSFGFFGIQIGFALQNANVSRIFQTLGASIDELPILWIAGPVTGLLVQPVIGYFSDRTWGPLGRRRPYFLAGAILASLALFVMPNSPWLWIAAGTLWVLDASINIAMEPFRAFVGDMLPSEQRTRGYAMQAVFIGAGALLASTAPYVLTNWLGVSNVAPAGEISDAVRYSFYLGGAAFLLAVLWTVFTTKEYSPDELSRFREPPSLFRDAGADRPARTSGYFLGWGLVFGLIGAGVATAVFHYKADQQLYVLGGGLFALGAAYGFNALLKTWKADRNFFSEILADLTTMPVVMQRLAIVQFFSWVGLFLMWIYATPTVTSRQFGATDVASAAYNEGANWIGILFAAYNGVAAVFSFILPALAERFGKRGVHALSLAAGAAGFASFLVFRDPMLLLVSMVGVGIAWASILTMPYAMLADSLPATKMGVYMGIFNFFIVLPQIMVAGVMGPIVRAFFNGDAAPAFAVAAGAFVLGALSTFLVRAK